MAYCVIADIEAEMKGVTFSGTTEPTSTQVNNWITQASARIDGELSNRFVIPITGTKALEIVKGICVELVMFKVKRKTLIRSQQGDEKNRPIYSEKDVLSFLEDIRLGNVSLVDAPKSGSSDGIASFTSSDPSYERIFKSGEKQW